MKRVNRILPVYTADISGICLTLYELGGMTVMHGASGCNSIYTIHDEPRWYSMDSTVYISALLELEAVIGDDEKLVRDTMDATLNLCPTFICIGGTPIPMMMGTDFKGIARMIENKTGVPTLGIVTNGMHSHVYGVGETLRRIVKRFCPPGIKVDRPATLEVNILGVTPLDPSLTGNTVRLKDFLRGHGTETVGCRAMESSLDELRPAGLANTNLMVSAMGLPMAAELGEIYGTPQVVGTPVGRRTSGRLAECIRQATRASEGQSLSDDVGYVVSWDADTYIRLDLEPTGLPKDLSDRKVLITGEQVMTGSLRCCLWKERGVDQVTVLYPTRGEKVLALEGDIIDRDEDEITRVIAENTTVVTDLLYYQAYPTHRNTMFTDFPHEACSGRMYYSIMRPFVCAPDGSV